MELTPVIALGVGFAAFCITFVTLPIVMKVTKSKGKIGHDVHKEGRPPIPEMGGISMFFALVIVSLGASLLFEGDTATRFLVFSIGVSIGGVIGIIDDLRPMSAIAKPSLLMLAAIPVLLFEVYNAKPTLPLVGHLRLTILYFALLPLVVSVPANSINMIDVYNGSMASMSMIVLGSSVIGAYLYLGPCSQFNLILAIALIIFGALLAFWWFNRYPARVFGGDTGSLAIGSAIGLLSVLGSIEFIVLVALIPMIMNSFSIISSVRGLKERRDMPAHAIKITEDYKLVANPDPRAPMTLARLILTGEPLTEYEAVRGFVVLSVVAGVFAIISGIIMHYSV